MRSMDSFSGMGSVGSTMTTIAHLIRLSFSYSFTIPAWRFILWIGTYLRWFVWVFSVPFMPNTETLQFLRLKFLSREWDLTGLPARKDRCLHVKSDQIPTLRAKPPEGQPLIILRPKLGQMVNGIVLPIKKVFALVDSKISVEIKDEGRKLQGRLVAVDEYLNIHMDETIEFVDNQRGRSLGTVVIRGNNILTIAPVI